MSNLSTTIKVDTQGFMRQLNSAKDSLKTFNNELKNSGSTVSSVNKEQIAAFDRVVKSMGKVADGSRDVGKQETLLKKQVQDLIAQWNNLDNTAKSSTFGQTLSQTLTVAKNTLKDLSQQVKQTKAEISSLNDVEIPSMDNGSNGGGALSAVTGVLDKAGFGQASSAIETLGSAFGGMGTAALGATVGIAAAGVAIKETYDFTKEAIQKSAEFGKALSELSSITGVTGDDLGVLRRQIQDIAKETTSTVVDVTNSMTKIGGAMPSLLSDTAGLGEVYKQTSTMAKAGLMEMDEATDALTTIMGQFNLGANDAAKTVDYLANASQAGSAEIGELAATAKVCGTTAAAAGLQVNEMSAMAEVLADKALKGSEAGTQMRNIFSKFSAEGIVGASSIMEELGKHAGDTAYMVQKFGVQNANAALILASGNDRYKELIDSLDKVGTASEMAATNGDNLVGSINKMQVAWDNFMSSFEVDRANGAVMEITNSIGEMVNSVIDLFSSFQQSDEVTAIFDTLGNAISACIDIITVCIDIISDICDVILELADAAGVGTSDMNLLNTAIDIIRKTFEALGTVIKTIKVLFVMIIGKIREAREAIIGWFESLYTKASDIPILSKCISMIKTVIGWVAKLKKAWRDFKEYVGVLDKEQKGKTSQQTTKGGGGSTTTPSKPTTTKPTTKGDTDKKKTKKTAEKKEKEKEPLGYVEQLEEEKKKLEKQRLKMGLEVPQEDIDKVNKQIDLLEKEIKAHKMKLGIDTSLSDLDKKVNETIEKNNTKKTSTFDKEVGEPKKKKSGNTYEENLQALNQELSAIEQEMNKNDQLISQLDQLIAKYKELGDTTSDGFKKAVSAQEDAIAANNKYASKGKKVRNSIEDTTTKQEQLNQKNQEYQNFQSGISSMTSSFSALGNAIGGTEGQIISLVSTQMQAIATLIPQIMSLIGAKEGEAIAGATASGSSMPYPFNLIAIAAGVAAVIANFAQIGSFASGGIISGATTLGDMNLARVNGGEMILNGSQQARLFNILNGGAYNATTPNMMVGEVKLKGSDIYLALKNYNKKSVKLKTL